MLGEILIIIVLVVIAALLFSIDDSLVKLLNIEARKR